MAEYAGGEVEVAAGRASLPPPSPSSFDPVPASASTPIGSSKLTTQSDNAVRARH